jgi:YfiR/HmsC-like
MRISRFSIFLIMLTALLAMPCRADGPSREYQVKAAFIYNFTQFIDWPSDAFSDDKAPFVVGVIGDDPFSGALEKAMADKAVGNHPIVIKHFATVADLGACQLLFIPASQDASLNSILAKVGNSPELTVGESDGFMPSGGAIRFFLEDGRMRFQLNPDVCDAMRLKVSAKLMKLARIYKK